jgi:hypothetical protein
MTLLAAVTAILVGNLAPGALPPSILAPAIIEAANKHDVDAHLLARIVVVESGGRPDAFNAVTGDHGLVQINAKTAALYGIKPSCLKDWKCNLDASAQILGDLMRIKGARHCLYNLGPKGRFEKYRTACERYETKLASF